MVLHEEMIRKAYCEIDENQHTWECIFVAAQVAPRMFRALKIELVANVKRLQVERKDMKLNWKSEKRGQISRRAQKAYQSLVFQRSY